MRPGWLSASVLFIALVLASCTAGLSRSAERPPAPACGDTFRQDRVDVRPTSRSVPITVHVTYTGARACTLGAYGPSVRFIGPWGAVLGGYGNIYEIGPVMPIPPIHSG